MDRLVKMNWVVWTGLLILFLFQFVGLKNEQYGIWPFVVFGVAIVLSVATPNRWRMLAGFMLMLFAICVGGVIHFNTSLMTLHFLLLVMEGVVFGALCAFIRLKEPSSQARPISAGSRSSYSSPV